MSTIKRLSVKSMALVLFVAVSLSAHSQSVKEAVEAYNKGATLIKSDPAGAITAFEKCVSISEQLGAEGNETKANAEKQLPTLYYTVAMNSYKKKEYSLAIKKFDEAIVVAEKYNNSNIRKKAERIIPQLYNIEGTAFYKSKDFDNALASFENAIERNANFAKPYLGKGLVYKNKGEFDKMLAACDKAIEVGLATGDAKTVASAEKLAQNTMFNNAVKALDGQNWDEAEKNLKSSILYGNNSTDAFFQLGKVYSALKKWEDSITNLTRALELEQGDDSAKARYYFELGNAYVGKGDTGAACSAYKNAMYGQYAEYAKYQVETVLKCK